jgi:hypothetical protein
LRIGRNAHAGYRSQHFLAAQFRAVLNKTFLIRGKEGYGTYDNGISPSRLFTARSRTRYLASRRLHNSRGAGCRNFSRLPGRGGSFSLDILFKEQISLAIPAHFGLEARITNSYHQRTYDRSTFCARNSRNSRRYFGRRSLPRTVRLSVNLISEDGLK